MATRKGWKASLVEVVGLGGVGMGTGDAYREAILEVTGEGAFGVLRREAGVHRVQRVPATESQGRVHTSTVGIIVSLCSPLHFCSLATYNACSLQVLPSEPANSAPMDDDLFDQKDVKVEVMRSRGAGGQVCSAYIDWCSFSSLIYTLSSRTARQQNRVGDSSHSRPNRRHRLDAGL